jgi:hypothetical protein
MPLETATFIDGLVSANPAGADAKSTADDHLRLIKSTVKATFPNITGAVTATQAELNSVTAKANIASPDFTGTPTAPTATLGNNTTQLATTAFIQAAIANVNAQTGVAVSIVSGTSQAGVAGSHYVLTNVAATTVTLPAAPASGATVWVTWTNSLTTNVIARNGQTIMGLAEDMTLDAATNGTVQLRFVNNSWRLV